jgi:hypothetical protein
MLDMIMSWISQQISHALEGAVYLLAPLLSFDSEIFLETFPFAATAYEIFQQVAIAIILLLSAFQMIPFFMGKSKTTPIRAGLFTIIAVFAVYFGNYLLTGVMSIAQYPYNELLNSDASGYYDLVAGFSNIGIIAYDVAADISTLIYIILYVLIGIAFLKLLIEAVERYIMLYILVYLSPLAASSLASEATFGICKRFFSMFLAQCLLLILNIWSLKMSISMFGSLESVSYPMLSLLCGYAFLRIASRLDSYLNQIGLNAAVTGVGLGNELIASGMALMNMGRNNFGSKSMNSGSNSAGKDGVLGLSKKIGRGITKASPVSGAAKAGVNALGALGKTVKQGAVAAKDGIAGTDGSLTDKLKAGAKAAEQTMKGHVGANLHQANMKTQDESLWARALGKSNPNSAWNGTKIASGTPLSDQQRHDVAQNPALAGTAVSSFHEGEEIQNSADISAMMQGIGLDATDPAATELLDVGNGNLDSQGTQFRANNNGLSASYERDGIVHDWDVKNASQFNALSPEQQIGYSRFVNGNGDSYYYRHNTTRAPTEAQRRAVATTENIAMSAANPMRTPLSEATMSDMSRKPELASNYLSNLNPGMAVTDPDQIAGVMRGIKVNGSENRELAAMHNEAVNRLTNNNFDGAYMNNRGIGVSWTDADGKSHSYSLMTDSAAAMLPQESYNELGMQRFKSGEQAYHASVSHPVTTAERAASEYGNFVANPVGSSLSAETAAYMQKNPKMAADLIPNLAAAGTSVPYNEDTAQSYSDVFAAIKTNGIRSDVKEAGVMALRSGEVNGTPTLDGNGMHFEFDHSGATHAITILPESRVADTPASVAQPDSTPVYDMEYLHNRGYQANNVEGTRYYSLDDTGPVGTKRFNDTAIPTKAAAVVDAAEPSPFNPTVASSAPVVQPAATTPAATPATPGQANVQSPTHKRERKNPSASEQSKRNGK